MGTESKDGDPPGVSPPPPVPAGQSIFGMAAEASPKGTTASGKEVVVSAVATLDDLSKMESSIMARLETLLLKYSGGGGNIQPPPVSIVSPLPVDQATMAKPAGVPALGLSRFCRCHGSDNTCRF